MSKGLNKQKWVKTFQFLAAYLVAAWTFLQFLEWVLKRYGISPNWVEVFLWIFVGIIPSLLIYLYHQERLNKRILKLREKIIFPLNVILLIVVMYFGFGNTDLGATTKEISYTNDAGELESRRITKEEFRVGVPIYGFKQTVKDSATQWLSYGIGRLLREDLLQNKSLSPEYQGIISTSDKIREASLFYDFYVDGSFQKIGSDFEITTHVRKASNGKTIKEQTFKGSDILSLIDDISVFVTSQAGFLETNKVNYIDLPIAEFMSNSLPAIKAYVSSDYRRAYDIDKSFALAYLEEAKLNTLYNRGQLETQDIIDRSFALKNKLPLQKQLEVYIQRNLAYNNYQEAEEQVKLQLEVDPSNEFYNQVLFSIYGETKNTQAYYKASGELFDRDPSNESGINLGIAALVNGDDQMFIDALKPFEIINPNIKVLKIEPLIFKGDIKVAEALFEENKISNPNNTSRSRAYDSIFAYLKNNRPQTKDLEQFVGSYRSEVNEQMAEYWINGDRIIQYIKNQGMRTMLPAGPNAIGGGFINNDTYYHELVKDETGKTVGLSAYQFYWKGTDNRLYWKIDEHIAAANNAFENKEIENAIRLYEIAIANNPKHGYLPNILSHLNFIKDKDQDSIVSQHIKFSGTYGPRNFWVEDNLFPSELYLRP
ncbi:MAG: hypothetical protein AAF901_10325 [Bacteroidota bacterium]